MLLALRQSRCLHSQLRLGSAKQTELSLGQVLAALRFVFTPAGLQLKNSLELLEQSEM